MSKTGLQWEMNASTGTYYAYIENNIRVARIGHIGPAPNGITYLYRVEDWGDYSLKYPVYGLWERSIKAALKHLTAK
jgi:hypothetical protein